MNKNKKKDTIVGENTRGIILMNIIATVNNKGGVGKTTIARILAEYFSKIKKFKVLAIDMDPQANFSNRFIEMRTDPYDEDGKIPPEHPEYDPNDPEDSDWDGISSISGIFFGEGVVPYPTRIANLDLLPAYSSKMLLAEAVTREDVVEKVYDQLAKFLELDELKSLYDIIIIDTAPSKGPLTRAVMRAASHIVIPSILEPSPTEGIDGLLHLWKSESLRRDEAKTLNLIGILANQVKIHTSMHKSYFTELQTRMPGLVLNSYIASRIIYSEVDSTGAVPPSIFDYPESNIARKEVMAVCEEIESRMEAAVHG